MSLLLGLAGPARSEDWQVIHDDGDVLVQQRAYIDSPLMELRGQTRLRGSLGEVMALLKDADFNDQWVYRS
ncbi:MAG: hypothetical protein ACPG1A_13165, partial [Halioglobus sp.]